MTKAQEEVVRRWARSMKLIYRAHYRSAVISGRANLWLGVPTAILSAIVGTSVFSALGKQPPSIAAQVTVGITSIAVTIFASLHTFLRYAERAEKHREAGAKFAALYHELEQALVSPSLTDPEFDKWMTAFRTRWQSLSCECPVAIQTAWDHSMQRTLAEVDELKSPDGNTLKRSNGIELP
jgi:hypothetical protein